MTSNNNKLHRGSYIRKAAGLGKSPTSVVGSPVAYTADSPILSKGQTFVFDTERLQPTYRQAYYIDEVRFRFKPDPTANLGTIPGFGGFMKYMFQTGSEKISKVHVPAWLYCPDYGPRKAYQTNAILVNAQAVTFQRWLLPHPMLMMPGDVLQASVENDAGFGLNCIANITYIGRTLPAGAELPKQRVLPWVSYMQLSNRGAPFSQNIVAGQFLRADEEFRNPFMTPLHVQRFTLRGMLRTNGRAEAPASAFVGFQLPDSQPKVVMSILDSLGNVVSPEYSSMGTVVDADRKAWTFERSIGPREAMHPTIKVNGNIFEGLTAIQVGMVASRKLEV